MTKDIILAKQKEKDDSKVQGIECGDLGKALREQADKRETEFPYVNLLKTSPELWF